MSVTIAILGLALIILIHEAGHFFTALAVRMRPRSFNLGFGPPLVKIHRGGIDYAVRAVPLGGYVKIPGMHRPSPGDVDSYFGAVVREAPQLLGPSQRLKRALAADDLDEARAELSDLEALVRDAGSAGAERGLQEIGDGLSRDAYWRQPTWKRIAVIAAGPGTNVLFAIVLFAVVLMSAGGKPTTTVAKVLSGRPAQAVGLQPGDRIVAINGRRISPSEISQTISASRGRPVTLVVRRRGDDNRLGPVRAPPEDAIYRRGYILRAKPLGAGESVVEAFKLTGRVTAETAKSLGNIVHKKGRDQLASPVGIVKESSTAARAGWQSYFAVLGFISLSLALLNLLPLLPLDGGHIAFSLAEGVRGRAVRREVYERVSAIGIALVLLLFFIGLNNDLGRAGS